MAKKTTTKKKSTKKKASKKTAGNGNGAALGFEAKLWSAADKMRGHMDRTN